MARAIAEGRTVEDVAEAQSGSSHTVRAHLKAVFLKTGTGRQAELVRLMSGGLIAT